MGINAVATIVFGAVIPEDKISTLKDYWNENWRSLEKADLLLYSQGRLIGKSIYSKWDLDPPEGFNPSSILANDIPHSTLELLRTICKDNGLDWQNFDFYLTIEYV